LFFSLAMLPSAPKTLPCTPKIAFSASQANRLKAPCRTWCCSRGLLAFAVATGRRHVKVARRVTREAREAIRQCLRENRTVTVLKDIPEEAMQQLLDTMERLELEKGSQVFRHGQAVQAMYIVESGELTVSKRLQQEDEEEFEATTLSSGSYIGELGLFYDRTCMESVQVSGDSPAVLWELKREDFTRVIASLAGTEEEPEECIIDPDTLDRESPAIFCVSDGSGYSAGGAVTLALKQFEYRYQDNCQGVSVTSFPFIRYKAEVVEITRRARQEHALVVYTLMRDEPREAMLSELERQTGPTEGELRAVDLYEPLLSQMEVLLGIARRPRSVVASQLRPQISEQCLNMVEAIEFTRKLDDGVHPELWKDADLILIGLSRAGKTPLSFFLAQRGFKVANYPVIPGEDPPAQLFDSSLQHKCIGLTIQAERLHAVRSARMNDFGRKESTYSSIQNCKQEVSWLKTFYMRKGPRWPTVDTTNGGLEEIAAKVLNILATAKGEKMTGKYENPSIV